VPIAATVGSVTAYCPLSDDAGNARPIAGNTNCSDGGLER
jgi:hypothetical protein